MSEEEKKMLKIFKAQVEKEEREYFSVNTYTQLLYDSHKTVLRLLEKKDKMIDLMAKEMKNKEYEYEDMCLYSEDCHGEYCEQCIKEHFRKKVENDN